MLDCDWGKWHYTFGFTASLESMLALANAMKRFFFCSAVLIPVLGLAVVAQAVTYTPTIVTDPPVSGGVNSANGVITGGAGNGQVSLRSAVIASNANGTGADIITLGTGTYLLSISSGGAAENAAQSGDLDINGSLTINWQRIGQHDHLHELRFDLWRRQSIRRQSDWRFQWFDREF